MKLLITILALLNGTYMLTDGIYVMLNGKYIGPPEPGPWANLFAALNLDVFSLGPLFVIYGILWLVWLLALRSRHKSTRVFGITLSTLTLWYLPVGTLFSIVVLATLLISPKGMG